MWSCFCNLLELSPPSVPESSTMAATLPLRFGGLGLSSAGKLRHAVHWASWADCIGMMHQRHPTVARTIIEAIESNNPSQTAQRVVASMESLRSWIHDPFMGRVDPGRKPEPSPLWRKKTFSATVLVGSRKQQLQCTTISWKERGETEEALLCSQGGPRASVPFTSLPTMRETSFDPQPFRLHLLRRLRLPLPLCAGVAVHSTALATTNQLAQGRESQAQELSHGDSDGAHLP